MAFFKNIFGKKHESTVSQQTTGSEFDSVAAFKKMATAKSLHMLSNPANADLQYENAIAFTKTGMDSAPDHVMVFNRLANSMPQQSSGTIPPSVCAASMQDGILVIRNYISKTDCEMLTRYADSQPATESQLLIFHDDDPKTLKAVKHEGLVSSNIPIDGTEKEVLNIFNDIYGCRLASFYSVGFEWYERPSILRYLPGGRYDIHSDADVFNKETGKNVRTMDRDYSVLLYLNDAYEGGEIKFTHQNYTIKPAPGMLIAFPSDYRYAHAALPVQSGLRYVIVSWGAIRGSNRVAPASPQGIIHIK